MLCPSKTGRNCSPPKPGARPRLGQDYALRPPTLWSQDPKIDSPDSYADGKTTDAERQLLEDCDPAHLDFCRQAIRRSRELAESLLKQGMLQDGVWTKVAGDLTDNSRWLSQHGAVIDNQDAQTMGLHVQYMDQTSQEWQAHWRLYCLQRLTLGPDSRKLFESDYASLSYS